MIARSQTTTFRVLNVEPDRYSSEARQLLCCIGSLDEAELTRREIIEQISEYDVLIVRLANQIDREIIDRGNQLKAIVSPTTGIDHIDIEYAKQRGIQVLTLRGETKFLKTICATSEHTWALLLALLRRIPSATTSVLNDEWDRDRFRGHEISGKRIGIVGFGRVGRKVAQYAKAFGAEVLTFEPYEIDVRDGVRRCGSLDELLLNSDIVSLHVPLNASTEQMISRKQLELIPRGGVLINTSRGGILDETALVDALNSSHLAGAAVDVIDSERVESQRRQNPLIQYARKHDNLMITPHIAGATTESMRKTEVFMAQKLVKFINGESS